MSHIQRSRGSFSSGKMKVLFKPDGPNPHTEVKTEETEDTVKKRRFDSLIGFVVLS